MNRRRFIQAAMSTLLVPHALLAAPLEPSGDEPGTVHRVFYDDRFPGARLLAARLAARPEPTPVQGDITELWKTGFGRACRHSPMLLHGVTTESFPFCLKLMLAEHCRIESQVRRLDPDLFEWSIRSWPPGHRSLAA